MSQKEWRNKKGKKIELNKEKKEERRKEQKANENARFKGSKMKSLPLQIWAIHWSSCHLRQGRKRQITGRKRSKWKMVLVN